MLLVGQLDSPFVRRVAVSMTVLGVAFAIPNLVPSTSMAALTFSV